MAGWNERRQRISQGLDPETGEPLRKVEEQVEDKPKEQLKEVVGDGEKDKPMLREEKKSKKKKKNK